MLLIAIYRSVSITPLFHGHYPRYLTIFWGIFSLGIKFKFPVIFKKHFTNIISLVFCLPRFYFEKSVISLIVAPPGNIYIYFFKLVLRFSLSLIFRSVSIMRLGRYSVLFFFPLYPAVFVESMVWCISLDLGNSQPLFLLILLVTPFLPFSDN